MSNPFENLVRSGFVGSLKRDVLLEADRDLEYVGAIRAAFADAGEDARRDAVACAARLISDLVAKGMCSLATWSEGYGSEPVAVRKSQTELDAIVAESSSEARCFDYFLITTATGAEWVTRYKELEGEL
jgi:hypothetical protein